jgi:hypothetical protein
MTGSKFFGNKHNNKNSKGKNQAFSQRTNHKRMNSGIRKTGRGK